MENEEVVEKQEEKIKKVNKGTPAIVILLILALLCAGGYIAYLEFFDNKKEVKSEAKTEEKNETGTEENAKETGVNEGKSDLNDNYYALINYDISHENKVFIGDKTYDMKVEQGNGIQQWLVINNKKIRDNDEYPVVNRVYVWHDILLIEWRHSINGQVVYAYDKNLKSLGELSSNKIGKGLGWYNAGLESRAEEYIRFNANYIELYHGHTGLNGELNGIKESHWNDVSCKDAKDKYKDLVVEEKLVYKYENGNLSKPERKVVLTLADAVCK